MTQAPSTPLDPVQLRDNYICQYCGKDGLGCLDAWHDSTRDHLIPLTKGGIDDPSNMVTSCSYCNSIKKDRVFDSLEAARAFVLKRRAELQADYERVRRAVRGG